MATKLNKEKAAIIKNFFGSEGLKDFLSSHKKDKVAVKQFVPKKQMILINPITMQPIFLDESKKSTQPVLKRKIKKPIECPEGKVLNPKTGRCIKIREKKKERTKTPSSQEKAKERVKKMDDIKQQNLIKVLKKHEEDKKIQKEMKKIKKIV